MKTACICLLLFACSVPLVQAGGQTESGREGGFADVQQGQFIDAQTIDADSYLDDFAADYKADAGSDLTLVIKLEKDMVLTTGDSFNLQVALVTNAASAYPKRPVNYVVFVHNPDLLLREPVRASLTKALMAIRSSMTGSDTLGLFNPSDDRIQTIANPASIPQILQTFSAQKKVYESDLLLSKALSQLNAIGNTNRRRFLWITDENLIETPQLARTFTFSLKLLAQNNAEFSYLGYGEKPQWAVMNTALRTVGGNSYFVEDPEMLGDTVQTDFNNFAHPTVEDITVRVALDPHVITRPHDFRQEWYSSLDAYNPISPAGVRLERFVKSMDYGVQKTFIFSLGIAAQNRLLALNDHLRQRSDTDKIPIGIVSVEYYSHPKGEKRYFSRQLSVSFTDSWSRYAAAFDPVVRKNSLIQNTPYILKEINSLVFQRRDYQTAILLVDGQMRNLSNLSQQFKDPELLKDIESLGKYKELMVNQAKSLNLIR